MTTKEIEYVDSIAGKHRWKNGKLKKISYGKYLEIEISSNKDSIIARGYLDSDDDLFRRLDVNKQYMIHDLLHAKQESLF